jgi:hypothetical protein
MYRKWELRVLRVPSLNTGTWRVYSMNKTGGRRKMFTIRAIMQTELAAAQQLLSFFASPCFRVKIFYYYGLGGSEPLLKR